MRTIDQLHLTPRQQRALSDIQNRLSGTLEIEEIKLYGSVSRGDADQESDVDLLIITRIPLARIVRHEITDIVCEVNLKYDSNFSTLVIDRASWDGGMFSVLPLRDEILRDGVTL